MFDYRLFFPQILPELLYYIQFMHSIIILKSEKTGFQNSSVPIGLDKGMGICNNEKPLIGYKYGHN